MSNAGRSTGRDRQFTLLDLFRHSVPSSLPGYEDTNHGERLAADPAVWRLASRGRSETSVAFTATLSRFERLGLPRLNIELVQREAIGPPTRRVTLERPTGIRRPERVHQTREQPAA